MLFFSFNLKVETNIDNILITYFKYIITLYYSFVYNEHVTNTYLRIIFFCLLFCSLFIILSKPKVHSQAITVKHFIHCLMIY